MSYSRNALFAIATSWFALLSASPVLAQEASTDSDNGEILVTARKRQESIMNVPVVATALNAEQLQVFQTQDLKGLATLVPGLNLGGSILSVGTQASIRGVGTSALDPGVDSSVALNIDGMTLSQGLAFSSGMFDVGQIEVLKGPQSLFFGKSSPGGVISIRSADPTDQFEVIGRAGYEVEARERRGDLIISGPVSETLKLRLAGTIGEQDGFYKNSAQAITALGAKNPSSRRITPANDWKIRATLLWNPVEAFNVRLKYNHVYDYADYAGTGQTVLCPDGTGPVNGRQFIDPNDCRKDRNAPLVDLSPTAFPGIPNNGTPFNRTTQDFGTLELNYHLRPDLTLTSATGYYVVNADSMLNATMSSAGAGAISAINKFRRRQFTEELRLASDFSGPLNFTLGGFLERGKFHDLVTIGGNLALGRPAVAQKGDKTVDIRTNSLFGQVLYKIVPDLELAAGARWTDETRTQIGVDLITGTPVPVAMAVPKIRARNVAPEVTLTYRPNSDLTIFGALKRGYKSGSFNVSTPPFTGEHNEFGDEKVEGGEIGLKSRLADRTVSFNLAGYYYRYSGLQVGANVQSNNGITATRTVNAGKARVYGIEADLTYHPPQIEGLGLRAAVNWNDAKYTELKNIPCYGGQMISEGCNLLFNPTANAGAGGFTSQDRSGTPLVRAPRWTANLGFDWETEVGKGMTLALAGNGQYSSRYVVDLGYLYYQGAFVKADASLALRGPEKRWEVALVGKNLNNALTTGNCANSNRAGGLFGGQSTGTNIRGPAGVDEVGCYMDRGRELWMRVSFAFH